MIEDERTKRKNLPSIDFYKFFKEDTMKERLWRYNNLRCKCLLPGEKGMTDEEWAKVQQKSKAGDQVKIETRSEAESRMLFEAEEEEERKNPIRYFFIGAHSLEDLAEEVDRELKAREFIYQPTGGPIKTQEVFADGNELTTRTIWHQAVRLVMSDQVPDDLVKQLAKAIMEADIS